MEYQGYVFHIIFTCRCLSKMDIETTALPSTHTASQWRYPRGFLCYGLGLVKLLIQSTARAVSKGSGQTAALHWTTPHLAVLTASQVNRLFITMAEELSSADVLATTCKARCLR